MHKPTLLMIHGLVGSLDYFDPDARIETADVRTLDLLGYGDFRDANPARLTLHAQTEHVASQMAVLPDRPVWLLGYSMGGAIAVLATERRPELVSGIINVEGNFTLRDAFWSRDIIAKSLEEWSNEYRAMLHDVPGWVTRCGVEPSKERVAWAASILEHQPAETVFAMSKAIVEETGDPAYLDAVRRVVEGGVPVHLIAGQRSAQDWDVPDFVRDSAQSYTRIAHAGHLMMLEQPVTFCRTVDSILASA